MILHTNPSTVRIKDKGGKSSLYLASNEGWVTITQLLLKTGANIQTAILFSIYFLFLFISLSVFYYIIYFYYLYCCFLLLVLFRFSLHLPFSLSRARCQRVHRRKLGTIARGHHAQSHRLFHDIVFLRCLGSQSGAEESF
jgi:hypothetical protein